MSRHSKLSRWVDREYRAALAEQLERPEGGLKIIPIRIDETALPTLIKDIRFADFRRDFSGAFEDLCDAIGINPIQAPFVAICYELGLDDADATRDRLIDLLTKQDIEPLCGIWHAVSDGAEQLHRELNALCGIVPTVVTSDQVALFLASGDQRIALVPLEQISIEEVLQPRGGSSSAYRYELRMRGVEVLVWQLARHLNACLRRTIYLVPEKVVWTRNWEGLSPKALDFRGVLGTAIKWSCKQVG